MQLEDAGGRRFHLGYCMNVLPGETVAALHEQLHRYCVPLRHALQLPRMGLGLWIAQAAAAELAADRGALATFREALAAAGLYVFTLNGFPYGGFHAPRVKARVFAPDWSDERRVVYTEQLAEILAALLPPELANGTISTVPLGLGAVDLALAAGNLQRVAGFCRRLAARTGRHIRICLEPEPCAALQLVERAASLLAELDREHLGVCFDCCHAAVVGESVAGAFAALQQRRVTCGKLQISSALVCREPHRSASRTQLRALDEPRFLHQVFAGGASALDIPDALRFLDPRLPWRIHFHVPVHRRYLDGFDTTEATIGEALACAVREGVTHMEVETYTWSVLPDGERPADDAGLVAGMAGEMRWALARLAELGVTTRAGATR
jgi:hypothetical protein